jgi:mannose-1-phosphate guanylyltransferase
VPASRTTVVVQECWESLARAQLRAHGGVDVLAQPCDRGTAGAILLALVRMQAGTRNVPVLLTPSDHGFTDEAAFLQGVTTARELVATGRAGIVLLGAHADSPRTDYGWILPAAHGDVDAQRVAGFVEKPSPPRARSLLRAGALWNTMVLVAGAGALLDLYLDRRPEDVAILQQARAGGRADLLRAFESLPPADFSRDILAGAPNLSVLPLPDGAGWTDLGTPERMDEFLRNERGFNGERIGLCPPDPAHDAARLAAGA